MIARAKVATACAYHSRFCHPHKRMSQHLVCDARGKKVAFVLTSINFISQNEMGKSHIPSIIIANIRSLPAALAKQQLTMMPFRAILQLFFHCY